MRKFMQEFKEFALRGNVMNLAVGVIIGAAFQGVVTSLSENILSPIIGLFAKQDFNTMQVVILGVPLKYGAFITSVINFLIMAFVVFLMVKLMNKVLSLGEKKPEEAPDPDPRRCPYCRTEIDEAATRCPACTSTL